MYAVARVTGWLMANVLRSTGLGGASERFVFSFIPIHCAVQSDEFSSPMVQVATGLPAE